MKLSSRYSCDECRAHGLSQVWGDDYYLVGDKVLCDYHYSNQSHPVGFTEEPIKGLGALFG